MSGEARFTSINAWIHTDIRGWTLADRLDDSQFAELQGAAQEEPACFKRDDGVRFAAPAWLAMLP